MDYMKPQLQQQQKSQNFSWKKIKETLTLIFIITIAIIFIGIYIYHSNDFKDIQIRKDALHKKKYQRYIKKYDRLNCSQLGQQTQQIKQTLNQKCAGYLKEILTPPQPVSFRQYIFTCYFSGFDDIHTVLNLVSLILISFFLFQTYIAINSTDPHEFD